MKVFLSWSGRKSRKVAAHFREWLPNVLQALQPFLSTVDTGKGTAWRERVRDELAEAEVGLVFLTSENLRASWPLFEAGALKTVCPVLVDVDVAGLPDPFAGFQATELEAGDLRKLISSLNEMLGEDALSQALLDNAFEAYWPALEQKLEFLRERDSEDLLATSYAATLEALTEADVDIKRIRVPLYQEVLTSELADFRVKLKRWQQARVVLVDHQYAEFIDRVYASAQNDIFATCSDYSIDYWKGRSGERLFSAHRRSSARVTRVFVFETRAEISDAAWSVMEEHVRHNFKVCIYINAEDSRFSFPPDLNRDFTVVDGGLIIGKANHRRHTTVSEWVFNDKDEKQRFAGYIKCLVAGSVTKKDDLYLKLFPGS
jgi:hypothetical protein